MAPIEILTSDLNSEEGVRMDVWMWVNKLHTWTHNNIDIHVLH